MHVPRTTEGAGSAAFGASHIDFTKVGAWQRQPAAPPAVPTLQRPETIDLTTIVDGSAADRFSRPAEAKSPAMIVTEVPGGFPVLSPPPKSSNAVPFDFSATAPVPAFTGGQGGPVSNAPSAVFAQPGAVNNAVSFTSPLLMQPSIPAAVAGHSQPGPAVPPLGATAPSVQPSSLGSSLGLGARPTLAPLDTSAAAAAAAAELEKKRREQAAAVERKKKQQEATQNRVREVRAQILSELKDSMVTDQGVMRHIESRKRYERGRAAVQAPLS